MDGRETGKPWEIAWGESSGGKERCGSDERVDGGETVRNSLGRAPVGRSDTGVTRGWTEGIETVGDSLGRVPVGRSDTGVTIRWTEGKPWEIAGGELQWEGAIRDERVDGEETVGNKNSMGRKFRWEGAIRN